jgi:hypothetical protein
LPLRPPIPVSGIVLLFLFLFYILVGRFSNIEIDSAYLYHSNFRGKSKVALEKLISIKDEYFPYSMFSKTAYGITIKYLNENGKTKKIKFLSPETTWGRHPFEIPELKLLKKIINKQ